MQRVSINRCRINNGLPGAKDDKVVLAHSLGNMVASAAISKYGMAVGRYFMLNAAVPAEAFDVSQFSVSPDNVMVHEDWRGIANSAWASQYHALFSPPDARHKLTWKGFFDTVPASTELYNYHSGTDDSEGDEVLELFDDGTPSSIEGHLFGQYAWHKQETHKGLGALDPAGTSWAGWGFTEPSYTFLNPLIYTNTPPTQAEILDKMQRYPLFVQEPITMFQPSISLPDRDDILANAIPALSGPAGSRALPALNTPNENRNIDMNDSQWRNEWPRNTGHTYKQRWLHSDIKDVAFLFNHKAFIDLVEKGGLE